MDREKIWDDFSSLPIEAQRQVVDFIAFLRARYDVLPDRRNLASLDLADEPFIGLWRDRPEMEKYRR